MSGFKGCNEVSSRWFIRLVHLPLTGYVKQVLAPSPKSADQCGHLMPHSGGNPEIF
jgi:hypothetical protein